MSIEQRRRTVITKEQRSRRDLIRLDLVENPYGPSLAAYEALSDGGNLATVDSRTTGRFHRELARLANVPADWVLPGNGIDELIDATYFWRRDQGPLVLFPPTTADESRRAAIHRVPVISLQRTAGFAVELDLETVADLPSGCWAIVQSPNDPTGTLVEAHDAVRLARACDLLVIDERHGAYSGRSLLPLAREFENIIVLQTMETWASLRSFPVAYAVGPPKLLRHLNSFRARDEIAAASMLAALATIDDIAYVRATVHRLRIERSRMFRMLRKLNMVSPCPSWANYLPVRVERGRPDHLVAGLAERGILVHRPPQPGLDRMLRISTGTSEQTDALKRALIEIGVEL